MSTNYTGNTNSLEGFIVDTLKDAKEPLVKSVEWLQKQVPDLCEQYITYNLYAHAPSIIGLFISCIIAVFLAKWAILKLKTSKPFHDDVWPILPLAVGSIGGITSVGFAVQNINMLLKIWVAPKVFLVEYAASLLK